MIHAKKHRIIQEIEKKRKYGQNFIILSGDGINNRDKFFYDLYNGILTLKDTLKLFYGAPDQDFTYFIHIISTSRIDCLKKTDNGYEPISIQDMLAPPKRKTPFSRKADENEEARKAATEVETQNDGDLMRLREAINQCHEKILIYVENLDIVAKLYETPSDVDFLQDLREWASKSNVLLIVTLSDMELLKKYAFNIDEIFIGNPDAMEIFYAWWRYIMRNSSHISMEPYILDKLSHSLSSGKNTLNSCMRILKNKLPTANNKFNIEDFKENLAKGIEEKVLWQDVQLDEDVKNSIFGAVKLFLNCSDEFVADKNQPPRKGLLFAGPPGTGKTLIAKALAYETNCYFMTPTLADLKGEYVGQSSAKIRKVFAEARANQPTILFIDEADTVFPSRNLGAHTGDSFGLDMVNQFLQEIEGAKTGTQKIFVIAATNRPAAVDEAIKSRLGKPVEIPLPEWDMRRKLFDAYIAKFQPNQPFMLKGKSFENMVLTKSGGMSGRDIANFIKKMAEKSRLPLEDNEATAKRFEEIFSEERKNLLNDLKTAISGGNILEPDANKHDFKDIIGLKSVVDKLKRHADFIGNNDIRSDYNKFGIEPARGIIMYGPSGNGKSLLAECLAGENRFYYIKILSKDFAANSSKAQLENLDKIFNLTQRFSKLLSDKEGIVLFFDEIDSLAPKGFDPVVRGTLLNYLSDERMLRQKDSKIIFIAATNFLEKMDEAVIRRGRIDTRLFIGNPTFDEGVAMLQKFAEKHAKTYGNSLAPIDKKVLGHAWEQLYNQNISTYIHGHLKDEAKENVDKIIASYKSQNLPNFYPSSSDLKELFRELKETAFHLNSFTPDQHLLKIDTEVVNKKFGI